MSSSPAGAGTLLLAGKRPEILASFFRDTSMAQIR
jgi:hypothetical protein